MSEAGDNPEFDVWHFGPENSAYLIPNDPYNDRLVQFIALKQMGYPVELQRLHADEVPEAIVRDMEWEVENHPIWVRPVVTNPDFEQYVEDPDVPGDCIRSDDEELDDLLGDHPIKLVFRVDSSDVHMLAYDLDCLEKDELKYLKSENGLVTKELLVGCFMAALDRYVDRKAKGYHFWSDSSWSAVKVDDFVRYQIYKMQGYRPVTPEQLGAIAMDYYRLAEQAQPKLLAFKDTSSTPLL